MYKKTLLLFSIIIIIISSTFLSSAEKKQFTISDVISIGLKNNPQILATQRNVDAKKAAFQSSKRLLNPEIEYHRGRGKVNDSQTKVNTEGFSISQPIENPLKRKYRVQMYEKDWQAAEFLLSASKLEIAFKIKNFFYSILFSQENEELAIKNFESLKEIHSLILKRAQLGEVKELEAIKLKVESLKAQNELNKVQTELRLAKERLNNTLGNLLPLGFSLEGKLQTNFQFLKEDTLIKNALLSHPLIKKKEKELEKAKSNLNYVNWQRLPDPKLSGFTEKEIDGTNKGIGISIEIPLWNLQTKAIAEAKSLILKEEEEFKALKMELTTEIKTKYNKLRLSEQIIQLFLSSLLKEAEASLKIAEVSYKQGEISLVEYLDSQRTYISILKDYQNSLFNWNINKASLEKSIGEELR